MSPDLLATGPGGPSAEGELFLATDDPTSGAQEIVALDGGPTAGALVQTATAGGSPASPALTTVPLGTALSGDQLSSSVYTGPGVQSAASGAATYTADVAYSCPASATLCPEAVSVTPGTTYNGQLVVPCPGAGCAASNYIGVTYSPAEATIYSGTSFSGQLPEAPPQSGETYTYTANSDSGLAVSVYGAITAPGTLSPGKYTVSGSSDLNNNPGTFAFKLTVLASIGTNPGSFAQHDERGIVTTSGELPMSTSAPYSVSGTWQDNSSHTGSWDFSLTVSPSVSSSVTVSSGGIASSPDSLAPGTYSVAGTDCTSTTAGGTCSSSGSNGYWGFMLSASPSTVTAVSPSSGPVGGGTTATITGTGFSTVPRLISALTPLPGSPSTARPQSPLPPRPAPRPVDVPLRRLGPRCRPGR